MTEGMELFQGSRMGNEAVAQNQGHLAANQRDELGGGEEDRLEAGEK